MKSLCERKSKALQRLVSSALNTMSMTKDCIPFYKIMVDIKTFSKSGMLFR